MKKITLFFAAFALVATTSVQAQSLDKVANDAATALCSCVNETYSFIDKDVQNVIVKMTKLTTEEEQTELVMGLDEDLQMRMMTQAMKMQDEQIAEDFETCVDHMGSKLDKLVDEKADEVSEETFVRMMVQKLRNKKGCEFATFLIETGMAEEYGDMSEDSSENERTNSNVNEKPKPSPKPNTKKTSKGSGGDERYGSGGN